MIKRYSMLCLVLLGVAAITGCSLLPAVAPSSASQGGGALMAQAAGGNGNGRNLDELFSEVAARAPGFGGMYLSGDVLQVYLTNPAADRAAAEQAITDVFGSAIIPAGGIQELQGQYGFNQLRPWHDNLARLFELDGVVLTDIDETANRLKIGVASSEAAAAVEQELGRLGVPPGAAFIVIADAIVPMATLRDRVRPLVGGLQINFPGYLCTYGFNAIRSGVSGFVTNSHCTTTQGGVEGTQYWQPLSTVADSFIGTEIADPTYTKAKCPASLRGKVCRWSDSSFAQHDPGATSSLGSLAQSDGLGSITIAGSYRVVGESPALVGQVVNKVGRTTGWSQGSVSATCVNTGVSGTNKVQLCQDHVNAAVGGGDSGSPVFRITNSPAAGDAQLYGILWGGNSSGTLFVYSPIANVQRSDELGSLTDCASGFTC